MSHLRGGVEQDDGGVGALIQHEVLGQILVG